MTDGCDIQAIENSGNGNRKWKRSNLDVHINKDKNFD